MIDNILYQEDLHYLLSLDLPWEKLSKKAVLISGGSGLIGSCFIDTIIKGNTENNLECKVIVLGRNESRARERFGYCWDNPMFRFVKCDVNQEIPPIIDNDCSYVIHLASNTHPVAYANEPVSTITTNIIGTRNMLDFAKSQKRARFVFASSNEIYGENRGDVESFDEDYCGYINSNTLRAGYPESKRCGEALCQAYIKQYGLDIVIPRFTRSYGPTLLSSDTKALSQFLHNGINKENIVLKSEGKQFFSYTYVADAVAGLLFTMLKGECGQAYNIADAPSDTTLLNLAQLVACYSNTTVVFDIPNKTEKEGFSKVTKARLSGEKIKSLGWHMKYNIQMGIERCMLILRQTKE